MVRDMLLSSARLQRAVDPLYACAPKDAGCYQRVGRTMLPIVQRERESFGIVLGETENDCLAEVGGIYQDALVVFEKAGRAAVAGETEATDAAIDESSPLAVRFVRKLSACGFAEGKMAQLQAELSRINIQILNLVDEMATCKSINCVRSVARRLESSSRDGVKAIDSADADLPPELPSCFSDALDLAKKSFLELSETAKALDRLKLKAAERHGRISDELGAQAQESLAGCLSSALASGAR
jgi:hypothetical protein